MSRKIAGLCVAVGFLLGLVLGVSLGWKSQKRMYEAYGYGFDVGLQACNDNDNDMKKDLN
jgi:hypothetical protein